MERITLAQLRQIVKEKGLRTYLELLPYVTGVQKMKFMTVVQLRGFAKKRGLRGYSDLRKDELITLINDAGITDEECAKEVGYKKKIFARPLYLYARDLGLCGYSRLRKADLIEFIKDERCITTDEEWEEEIKRMSEMLARNVVNAYGYTLDEIVNVIHICIMERHTVARLRKIAKDKGLHGYSRLRKAELIRLIQSRPSTSSAAASSAAVSKPQKQYRKIVFVWNHSGGSLLDTPIPTHEIPKGNILKPTPAPLIKKIEKAVDWGKKKVEDWGSSYIKLPKHLESKKTIINMKNKDEECFKWCVTRALHPVQSNPKRITKILRKQAEKLVWDGIEFPMEVKSISRFEKLNPEIGVNVYMYENGLNPLRVSSMTHAVNVVDLLLISEGDKKHYCLIKNLSRLVSSSLSKNEHKKFICRRCLNYFGSQRVLDTHSELCQDHEAVSEKMPKEGTYLSFKNHQKQMTMPFVIYADFESIIKPLDTVQAYPERCYTERKQQHIPISFCYYVKCTFDDSYSKRVEYTAKSEDEDVAQTFVEALEAEVKSIYTNHPTKEMIFTDSDAVAFENATCCWLCGEDFEEGKDKVRDHCHYTGKFRGAAHNSCNLKYQRPKFTPVVLPNLANYDAHLFVRNLGVSEGEIDCIPNNEEKYISFTKHVVVDKFFNKKEEKDVEVKRELRFIDSFKFMASSLDELVKNLAKKGRPFFKNTGRYYSGEKLKLLMRKGVYPYEWMDSIHKLDESHLPPKEAFFSKLSGRGISNKDYTHAQKVWRVFACKTFRDYHNLYNSSDVLLLADVFENFRELCKKIYDLDPCWYFTAPGLGWDACLKLTEIKLELLTDINMLHMFEAGIRGGISMISTRHSKANNKYMGKRFDPTQPSKFIMCKDANNLYAWAMSKCLPTGGFEWVDEKDFGKWKSFACILEVDLKGVKEELHDHFNDYPPAPENLLIGKVHKLVCTLNEKKKYIVHHETLKHYMSLGIEIEKIHRIIRFEESPWMKEYIDLNTSLRTKANNDFEKDFYKLMNNAVFGKTMENIRKRVDVRLVTSDEKAKKLTNKVNFKHCTIFSEDLCAIHMGKTQILFNKPLYLGMSILDLSKTLMYNFHYNYIKPKYPEGRSKLLFTDTDSLCYEIQTEDFYKDIIDDVDRWFDTSNIKKGHSSGIPTGVNKKVIGMFKDEAGGKIIEEFVGLRAKLYCYRMFGKRGKEKKKCKGTKKSVVQSTISFANYKKCLFGGGKQLRKINTLRSRKHEMYMEEINKVALSADDDKRIILPDKIQTLSKEVGNEDNNETINWLELKKTMETEGNPPRTNDAQPAGHLPRNDSYSDYDADDETSPLPSPSDTEANVDEMHGDLSFYKFSVWESSSQENDIHCMEIDGSDNQHEGNSPSLRNGETDSNRDFCENHLYCTIKIGADSASQQKKEKKRRKKQGIESRNEESPTQSEDIMRKCNALLNFGGGVLEMKIADPQSKGASKKDPVDCFWQTIEGQLKTMIRPSKYDDVFDRRVFSDKILLFVNAPKHLCTMKYNLFVSGDSGVDDANYDDVVGFLKLESDSHKRNLKSNIQVPLQDLPPIPCTFFHQKVISLMECKQVQFKDFASDSLLFSHPKQRFSIARQLSAFGNCDGGVLLIGVRDDRRVSGVDMVKNKKEHVEECVSSLVDKMCCNFKLQRGIHWDLTFSDVSGSESKSVIVVKMAGMRDAGGIFGKCPESYILQCDEDGQQVPHQLDFDKWKGRMKSDDAHLTGNTRGMIDMLSRFQQMRVSEGHLLTVRGDVQRIRDAFFKGDDTFLVSPEGVESSLPAEAQAVIRNIQKVCRRDRFRGFLAVSRSWLRDTGGTAVDSVICDVLLVSRNMGGLHLYTLCDAADETSFQYSKEAAQSIKKRLSENGARGQKFYVSSHVLPCRAGREVKFPSPDDRYPKSYDLLSPRGKLNEILKAMVVTLAAVPSTLSCKLGVTFFNLLTTEQFRLVHQQIEVNRELWIKGVAGTGKTLVAVEFMRELRRREKLQRNEILYVCENEGIASQVRKTDLCNAICRVTFIYG
ncbi:Schlafen family member 5 [Stylophora pistillata]|uniref:Schlafen family member 5 n=1 Tax=Stylophora pistillata TaxID=50429 RepID=A0A2B4SQP8_STYPI|nr:Schlafen family member 5 [Stylophora pistillata]